MKDGKDAQKVLSDHSSKTEQTSNALNALTAKLTGGSSSSELQLKKDQLKLNQDHMKSESEAKRARVALNEKKFLSEKIFVRNQSY